MRAAIVLAAAVPPVLGLACWFGCACAGVCPAWLAAACLGVALAAGAAIFVIASLAWVLHGLSRHRPAPFRAEGYD